MNWFALVAASCVGYFVLCVVLYTTKRYLDRDIMVRTRAYDCPDCGIQVNGLNALTEDEWKVWCRTRGGCRPGYFS